MLKNFPGALSGHLRIATFPFFSPFLSHFAPQTLILQVIPGAVEEEQHKAHYKREEALIVRGKSC
jgi:hypothetical protein